MILLLRGVPGSGKSTIARALVPVLDAVILDKDVLRADLFPEGTIEYTTAQDDFVVSLMLQAVQYHLQRRPDRPILLDGRVHATSQQVELVRRFSASLPARLHVLECRCSRETALRRIEADRASGVHLAANRDAALLDAQIAKWQRLDFPVCALNTEKPLAECVQQAKDYLRREVQAK